MNRNRRTHPNRPSGTPAQASVSADTASPRPVEAAPLAPEARRREVARLLAAAVVRLQTRRSPRPATRKKLSKSSPTALESARRSATHVTVREAVNAQPEDRT